MAELEPVCPVFCARGDPAYACLADTVVRSTFLYFLQCPDWHSKFNLLTRGDGDPAVRVQCDGR